MPRPTVRPSRAFTLIELLVVVAIISLLISILAPSLSRAREQAKSTHCLARLNELMKAVTSYTNDYEFSLPPMRYEATDPRNPGTPVFHGWAESLYRSLYRDTNYAYDQPFPVMRNADARFEKQFDLWTCLEGEPREASSGHYRVYESSWRTGSLDKIPPRLPVMIDANPQVSDPLDLLRSDIPAEHLAGLEGEAYIDERHYGGANFAFGDGHASRSTQLREQLALDWDLDPDTPNE